MKILGVNGIQTWSWSNDSFTDKILNQLKLRYEVKDVRFPRMWAIFAYFNSPIERRAQAIIDASEDGDHVVAHSFGCLATLKAMEKGRKFGKVFFFAPACEVRIKIPKTGCEALYVIHSKTDRALMLGEKFLPEGRWFLPNHPFGRLGLDGYRGRDKRVVNVNADGMDHCQYVEPEHLWKWREFIFEKLTQTG